MKKRTGKKINRIIAGFLVTVLSMNIMTETRSLAASAKRKITISQAVAMGIAESRDYRKTKNKISLKQVKYKEAVKSIYLKKKNMSTFRWSPLLSFKFPEKATLAEEFEFIYKPLQIQSEIDVLKHNLEDVKYETAEKVSNLYTEIYTYQEKIEYKEKRLDSYRENLKRNQAKLLVGEAKQSDVDKISSNITAAEKELSADKRAFEKGKADLSDLIGLNITSGYEFLNPYKEMRIDRSILEQLVQTTLEKSQSYYEAKMTTRLALISVDTNFSLMSKQYGGKMSYISGFVTQAKQGEKINSDAFKVAYDKFLTAIDAPWQGNRRILFIKIPKEWFKGSIDGVRYVEDDPYILYTNVLEYQEAVSDQKSLESEIRKNVENGFENLVTAKNTYDSLDEQTKKAKEAVTKAELQNKAGELTFEEFEEIREEYEELQISRMEALELYTQLLYSYDRLTCGGIKTYLESKDELLEQGGQGESYITDDMTDGAYYYITNLIEDNLFELGIYLPEDYETDITHFELWIDGVRIGEKTEVGKTIRHLTLDLEETNQVIIRAYDGDKFVSDCQIEPKEYRGKLDFKVEKKEEEKTEEILGAYQYTKNKKTGMLTFNIEPKEDLGIKWFKLKDSNGTAIYSEEPIEAGRGFTYLSILSEDFSTIQIELYDENKNLIATGKLDTKTKQILKMEEG